MGRGGPRKRNCTFCKSTFILQTPDSEKNIRCFFPCLVWSPPMYSKSWPSYILNVSFGSQVSRICRSKKFRISGNLEVSEPGDLVIWKSGKLGIWILSKTVLCLFSVISGLRYALDFSSFMFELQPFGTIVFVSLVFGNPKAALKRSGEVART